MVTRSEDASYFFFEIDSPAPAPPKLSSLASAAPGAAGIALQAEASDHVPILYALLHCPSSGPPFTRVPLNGCLCGLVLSFRGCEAGEREKRNRGRWNEQYECLARTERSVGYSPNSLLDGTQETNENILAVRVQQRFNAAQRPDHQLILGTSRISPGIHRTGPEDPAA